MGQVSKSYLKTIAIEDEGLMSIISNKSLSYTFLMYLDK